MNVEMWNRQAQEGENDYRDDEHGEMTFYGQKDKQCEDGDICNGGDQGTGQSDFFGVFNKTLEQLLFAPGLECLLQFEQ